MTGGTPHEYGKGDDTARVMAFSDGVFAIAITLLVLNLKVPPVTEGSGLFATLGEQWPEFWAFLISFAVIGQLWIIHHSLFYYIVRYDRRQLWLNLLVLLCVSFMPFPTAILAESDHTRDAVSLYAATLGVTFAVQLVIWRYATSGHRLVAEDLDPGLIRHATFRSIISTTVFFASIGIAFLNPLVAQLAWLAVPLGLRLLDRGYRREIAAGGFD